jgi:DNA-binding NarL/FixJ family response regulator
VGRTAGSPAPLDADTARELYVAARFTELADALAGAERRGRAFDPALGLLRARVHLVRDPAAALVYVTDRSRSFTAKAHRAEAALIAGASYARLGDHVSAEATLKEALKLCPTDGALAGEVNYQRAASAWMQRKLPLAERILARAGDRDLSPAVRIQSYVLQGAIEASRGDVTAQAGMLLAALRFVRRQQKPSVLHWAHVVSQIAYLARELPSAALRDAAYEEFPKVPWTSDIAAAHFTTLRAIGWCHALDGDYFNAFRRLKQASLVAPSPGWRVMSFCDRAYLARCLGEPRWAEQERNDARELAASVPWAELDGEERFALLLLAELLAESDGPLALAHIADYRKSAGRFDRTLASASDRRVDALESYSLGVVQQALGHTKEAVRLLSNAYAIYHAIGYSWRAGRAAKALAAVTGLRKWRTNAANALSAYPRSWLVADDARARPKELPGASRLTTSQQAVFELLVQGLSTREIAARLHRSEFTVSNHVKAIFKAMNVKTRSSLIARAAGTNVSAGP